MSTTPGPGKRWSKRRIRIPLMLDEDLAIELEALPPAERHERANEWMRAGRATPAA